MTNERIIDEMDRAFIVLGFDIGEMQNEIDLNEWARRRLITKAQHSFMVALNRRCAKLKSLPCEIAE